MEAYDLIRVSIWVGREDWKIFQDLKLDTGETASWHLREAMKMYLRVLQLEDSEIFESRSEAREEDTCN